ncbi:hypothetical protein LCGC14_2006720, partial [marine sediment metagenome]
MAVTLVARHSPVTGTDTTSPTHVSPERSDLSAGEPVPREGGSKPRILLIVNPMATTVSHRLKNLVVYALRGRYHVDAVETESRNHATALTRDAATDSYDLVVAFGGDGTVNEAANGLVSSSTPLAILPGGSTNVVCRLLGIPTDVVDATERLISFGDRLPTRSIDLGRVGDRYFVSSSGVGLDAEITRWVDERPPLKARGGPLTYAYGALTALRREYAGKPARIAVEAGGQHVEGVTAVIQNSDPFTYFGSRPVRVCEDVAIDSGTLSMTVFRRASQRD